MRIFRTSYKDKQGQAVSAQKWYIDFTDHLSVRHRIPAFADKRQSEALGRQIESLVNFRSAGQSPDAQMCRWLETLSAGFVKKLVAYGLVDGQRAAAGKTISEHLQNFKEALLAKGGTGKHANLVFSRAKSAFDGCRFVYWSDISASAVLKHISSLRADSEQKRGISAQTFNFYIKSCQQFCRWMVQDRRASENPLQHLKGLNVQTDRRHDRRALSTDEMRRLLEKTKAAPYRFKMTGIERAILSTALRLKRDCVRMNCEASRYRRLTWRLVR